VPQSSMSAIKRPAAIVGLSILLMLALASVSRASEAQTIIYRCNHGQSLSGFKQGGYRKALRELSTISSEYTDCGELIRQAQLAATAHRGGTGGPQGGSEPNVPLALSPSEQHEVQSAHNVKPMPLTFGKDVITPGVVHANIASAVSSLPSPLVATIAFAIALGLVIALASLRNRVRTKHPS
jgi:hypothetical protein